MSANEAIADYLRRVRRRLKWLTRVRVASFGLAATVGAAVAFAMVAAYLVPSQAGVVTARLLLYAMVAATVAAAIAWRLGASRAVHHAEQRVPAFGGRLRTWFDASRRAARPALLPQLAADLSAATGANPPSRALPLRLFIVPVLLALAAVAFLAWFLVAAPQHLRLPAERLLLGEAFADTRPRIAVRPGDTVVARGTDVQLVASAHGFAADALSVHATFAGAPDWEVATMVPGDGADHEFVVVAVMETLDYFVSAGGVRSDRYRIEVADVPVVEGIDVTLDFPAWTRLDPRRQDHGDVAGVGGTRVTVTVSAEPALVDGELVVDGERRPLDGADAGSFVIEADGSWHIAARHRGESVRISPSFLIEAVEDLAPEVEFAFPGRDRSASSIEEVALRFRARDDFGVEGLHLHYAVNGGAWQVESAAIASGQREALSRHLLSLEDLAAGDGRAIRPGDVVAVFAEARDHGQSTRSALYFVDVRPFDKRYRQRADTGGAGGGGGGGDGLELSTRQRDIAAATWNLIRERDAGTRTGDALVDQVDVVAILQATLKEQVETLIARSEGRRLSSDAEVGVFVDALKRAVVAMEGAAQTLQAHDLDAAVAPEQRALQHLLTAEASLRDVDVTLTRSDSQGDAVSRSLSELADLELDPARNRYETPEMADLRSGRESGAESDDGEWERLTELARRHEELARQAERNETREAPLSRWQLERLKRELESLRERLADAGQSRPGGQQSAGAGSARLEEAIANLEQAMGEGGPGLERGEAEAQALRQGAAALRDGAERLRQQDVDDLAARLRRAEELAGGLLEEHQRIGERLEALQQELLRATRSGERRRYRDFGLYDEAETKRRMQEALARISADLADIGERLKSLPEGGEAAARQIELAVDELARSRVNERLGLAAEYFEMGSPLFVIGQEGRVETALEAFRERLDLAAERMEGVRASGGRGTDIDDVQRLRRRLEGIGQGGALGELDAVASEVQRMAWQLRDQTGSLDLEETRARYRGLGAARGNRERLYRMTLAELDRLEIALGKVEGASVRAPTPRERGYESPAVARYFRQLSCEDC